jgi:hypothetical protein
VNRVLVLAAIGLPSIACFVGAAFVAYRGNEGWGWLIFVGFLVCPLMNESASERLIRTASGMSTGMAKTPKAVEGRSPASPAPKGDAQ